MLKEYKNSLKMVEIEEWVDTYFYRILAFIFVKSVYRFPITPNQVTYIALIFGITGGILVLFGQFVLGSVSLMLSNIFDCADGQLARIKKLSSPLGRFIDGIVDYYVYIVLYHCLLFYFLLNTGNYLYILILIATALSNIYQAMLVDQKRQEFLFYLGKSSTTTDSDIELSTQIYNNTKWNPIYFIKKISYFFLVSYFKGQKKFSLQLESKGKIKDIDYYYKINKKMIRFWTFLGPSMHITLFAFASFMNNINLYFILLIIPMNIYLVALYLINKYIVDRKIDEREKSLITQSLQ